MLNKWIYRIVIVGILLLLIVGCQSKVELSAGEGYVNVSGGNLWYRIVGEGTETPILLLHGGPGVPSYYLNPLAKLSDERPVIFLDQFGCGRSDINKDTSLMKIDVFVEQLEQFIDTLGLKEFYLYGHSWGAMLGMDYYLKYPDKVKALIFASPCMSASRWIDDCKELLKNLPDSIQLAIKTCEETGNYDSEEYQNAMNVFFSRYMIRKSPMDANIDSTFKYMNSEIYNYMWGYSDFNPIGTLKTYERIDRLQEISVPTLYNCGEFDEVSVPTLQYYHSLTPNSKYVVIKGAGHITMHDNPEQSIQGISKFMREVEGRE